MATIIKSFPLAIPADAAWAALADFANVHTRLAPGFLTDARMEGDATRVVTFFNGAEVRETLVTRDGAARRLVYTATGGKAAHHNAVAQIDPEGPASCRFVWTTDVLPDALAPYIESMMERGAGVMQATLQAGSPPA